MIVGALICSEKKEVDEGEQGTDEAGFDCDLNIAVQISSRMHGQRKTTNLDDSREYGVGSPESRTSGNTQIIDGTTNDDQVTQSGR